MLGKKAFTLVEIMIVLVIASILIGVLFQVYRRITDVALRVRYEKDIGNKVVTMQTLIQNVIDTHTIDYNAFTGITWTPKPWWTTKLPLLTLDNKPATLIIQSGALLFTTTSGNTKNTVSLLWDDVQLLKGTFVIMPITNPAEESSFSKIYQPWVWVIGTLAPINYTGLVFPLQTFFTTLQR